METSRSGVGKGSGLQQDAADDGKDGRGCADAEPEGQRDGSREAGIAPEEAEAVPQVLPPEHRSVMAVRIVTPR